MPLALARRALVAAIVAPAGIAFSGSCPARAAGGGGRSPARAHHPTRPRVHPRRHPRRIVVHVTQTASTLSQLMKRLPDMRRRPGRPHTPMVVHLQGAIRYQKIVGFGATLTDSSAWLIRHELAPAARDQPMRTLFSSRGIDLNSLRLPMGASDYTAQRRPYSYDDLAAGRSDPRLRGFSVAHHRRYIIPPPRQALAIPRGMFIIANPWSPPAWMKTNQRSDNFDRTGTLLPTDYRPLAAYFVRFLKAYRRLGVGIDAVTPQNEPVVAA